MSYVDGFVCAVATNKRESYRQYAEKMAEIFKQYGAEKVVECWGDKVPDGELTSFPLAVKCKDDETVVFSWVWWPSKTVQEAGWEKFMQDPLCDPSKNPMPFDGKRLIYGSFEVLVNC